MSSVADLRAMLVDIETLVTCESPSADLGAVGVSAEAVARLGEARLGVPAERIVIDGVNHLRWRLGSEPRKVLLLGHHDTVWPVGSLAARPFSVGDGVLRGPGCFDMKTGLVMAFHAVAALEDRAGVTILVTGDEEVGAQTSAGLIEQEASGCIAALVLEASADGGALKTERKGVSHYVVTVTGRAAHAGLEPERGINASVELAHQLLAVASLGGRPSGTTVTPTVMSGGTSGNTVPASARFEVDVRTRDLQEQERVDAAIRLLAPVLPGALVDVTGGATHPPLESAASADLFARASQLAEGMGMDPLSSAAVGGASDGNLTAGMGVPTLDGLGAVGGGAHAEHEHVLVDDILPRTALLKALIGDVLGSDRPVERDQSDLDVSSSRTMT